MFKSKAKTGQEKDLKLEQLMAKHILVRLLEDMEELDVKKFEQHTFNTLADLTKYLKNEIPELENKVKIYMQEFTHKYGRIT